MITSARNKGPQAFTLLDLVIALATVASLGLLLTPALARTRGNDQVLQCLNNLRQLTAAWSAFAEDNESALASTWTWVNGTLSYTPNNPDNTNIAYLRLGLLGRYVQTPAIYKCPADQSVSTNGNKTYRRVRSLSMNQMFRSSGTDGHATSPPWTIYKKRSDMVHPLPAKLWLFTDENPDSINDASFGVRMDQSVWEDGPGTLHNGGCNFSFADGHAEMKHWMDLRSVTPPMATTYRTTFPFELTQLNNPDIQWLQDRTTARQ